MFPLANAGRLASFASISPLSFVRDAAPTRSIWAVIFGKYFSSSGILSVIDESFIVNRSVLTMPSRRNVSTPSAGVNGEITSSSATSPGTKSFLDGMICTCSCSTLRFGGVLPPGTQTVNSLSLNLSLSSITVAVIVYRPPCLAIKVQFCGLSPDLTVHVCSLMVCSFHEPLSNAQSFKTALISASRPVTRLPSMSDTIDSTSIFSPFWTNVRGVFIPTYSDDG